MAEMKNLTINGTQFTLPFAPDGYGLGGTVYNQNIVAHIQKADQLNTATKCGWYACTFGDGGAAFTLFGVTMWNAVLFVSAYIDSRLCQELYATQQGVKFIRWCYNGTWTEWECVNPPMALGVEYRTTERWNGKAVYTKLIDCGEVSGTKTVYHSATLTNLIRAAVKINTSVFGDIVLPFIYGGMDSSYTAIAYTSRDSTGIVCGGNISGQGYLQIWYTKD